MGACRKLWAIVRLLADRKAEGKGSNQLPQHRKGDAMGKRRNGRTKAPWEKPYVHTDERDGGKYIDPDEYLDLKPVREQREKLPRIARSRPGVAQDR